jgi:serine/threonine protein kinase
LLKNEKKTSKYDVYCFGLVLLEMITSDVPVPNAFKYLCRLINQGYKDSLISMIEEDWLRDILKNTLNDDPEGRWTVADLQNHQFFRESGADHKAIQLKP